MAGGAGPGGQGAWEVGNALRRLPLTQQNAHSSRHRVPTTNLQPRSLCEGLEINPESQVPTVPGRQVSRSAWHRRGPTWGRASRAPKAPGGRASGRGSIRSDRLGGSRRVEPRGLLTAGLRGRGPQQEQGWALPPGLPHVLRDASPDLQRGGGEGSLEVAAGRWDADRSCCFRRGWAQLPHLPDENRVLRVEGRSAH